MKMTKDRRELASTFKHEYQTALVKKKIVERLHYQIVEIEHNMSGMAAHAESLGVQKGSIPDNDAKMADLILKKSKIEERMNRYIADISDVDMMLECMDDVTKKTIRNVWGRGISYEEASMGCDYSPDGLRCHVDTEIARVMEKTLNLK